MPLFLRFTLGLSFALCVWCTASVYATGPSRTEPPPPQKAYKKKPAHDPFDRSMTLLTFDRNISPICAKGGKVSLSVGNAMPYQPSLDSQESTWNPACVDKTSITFHVKNWKEPLRLVLARKEGEAFYIRLDIPSPDPLTPFKTKRSKTTKAICGASEDEQAMVDFMDENAFTVGIDTLFKEMGRRLAPVKKHGRQYVFSTQAFLNAQQDERTLLQNHNVVMISQRITHYIRHYVLSKGANKTRLQEEGPIPCTLPRYPLLAQLRRIDITAFQDIDVVNALEVVGILVSVNGRPLTAGPMFTHHSRWVQ